MRKRFRIILDGDDVLLSCNGYALQKLNAEKGTNYTLEDIHTWGPLNSELDERLKYFNDPEFTLEQPPLPGAVEFVEELSKRGEVLVCTSVPAKCAGARVQNIISNFPSIKMENIIIGNRKDMLTADVILDDGYHNLENSQVRYPVLYRRPWNHEITGITSVSNYQEFITLIDIIQANEFSGEPNNPNVISLVGVSGSDKNRIAQELSTSGFCKVKGFTTRQPRKGEGENYYFISKEEFLSKKKEFIETSTYMGDYYGTLKEDIDAVIRTGNKALLVLDINGAIAMKRLYGNRAMSIYIDCPKEICIRSVLERNLSLEESVQRISSIETERLNEEFCDITLHNNGSLYDIVEQIKKEAA